MPSFASTLAFRNSLRNSLPRQPEGMPLSGTMLERLGRIKSKVLRRTDSPGRAESEPETPQIPEPHPQGLHKLFPEDEHQPGPPGPQKYPVDIIAVHGLNGGSYSTWTHKPDKTLWLRDLLPSFLPGCRVYTYGYPSQIFSESFGRVHDFARRLLIEIRDLQDGSTTVRLSTFRMYPNISDTHPAPASYYLCMP